MLKKLFNIYSTKSRRKSAKIFLSFFHVNENTRILDLGGGDGGLISKMLPQHPNIHVADIDTRDLQRAKARGLKTILLDESGKLPFNKNDFDIIFSNSVIEHVTVDKSDIYNFKTEKEFWKAAFQR